MCVCACGSDSKPQPKPPPVQWTLESTPNPGNGTASPGLSAVDCPTADACLAIGTDSSGNGLALRPSGTRWQLEPAPTKGAVGLSGASFACATAHACTTVGSSAERWNGRRWISEALPRVAGESVVYFGVSCSGPSFCMAVGAWYDHSGTRGGTLAARWDGAHWVRIAAPSPARSELVGISCTAANSCMAVGDVYLRIRNQFGPSMFAERWNGSGWTLEAMPRPTSGSRPVKLVAVLDVSCPSARICTAVGGYVNPSGFGSNDSTLVERWSGDRWRVQASPTPDNGVGDEFWSVSCPATSSCTAVGEEGTIEHWAGSAWKIQGITQPPGTTSGGAGAFEITWTGVSCPTTADCIAVGNYTPHHNIKQTHTLVERWDGHG